MTLNGLPRYFLIKNIMNTNDEQKASLRLLNDFLFLLKTSDWIDGKVYRLFYGNDETKRKILVAAIDNGEINFQVVAGDGKPYSNNINELIYCIKNGSHRSFRLYEERGYQRTAIISNYLAHPFAGIEGLHLILESSSFELWLKEKYYKVKNFEGITSRLSESTSNSSPSISQQGISLPYEHEYESSLLKIAVECWKALYEDGGPDGKKIRKPQIEAWVQEHYPDVSDNSRKTISTIVNPFKKGGASPSE